MGKALWLFSPRVSFTCAVFFFFYGFTGLQISWMSSVILAVFFGMGVKAKDVPAIFCSILAGLIWEQLNFAFLNWGTMIGIPAQAAMFIAITLLTTVTMGLHLTVLGKTLFNRLPFIPTGVALAFSQGGENELGLAFTLIAGLLLTFVCGLGETFTFTHFAKQQPTEAPGIQEEAEKSLEYVE